MTVHITPDTDVLVVGGGLAGMTLTALLATHGISVICLDRDDPKVALSQNYDARTTAISYGSQRVMRAAGVWDETILKPCAIRDIHILDGGSPVLLEFLSDDIGGTDFGWIVDNRDLRQSLFNRLHALANISHIAPATIKSFFVEKTHAGVHLADGRTVTAALVIGADGKRSATRDWMNIPVRSWSYDQQAIVCIVYHEHPHNHVAIEHFLEEGPFALLPMQDDSNGHHRSALVWSEHLSSRSKLDWTDDTFIAALKTRLPSTYGDILRVGKRTAYPLTFTHAYSYIGPRMALVADAAHAIHPIAGQGLNLGLRDIAALAELIVQAKDKGHDVGADTLLEVYQQQRRFDNSLMAAATDGLNRLFSKKSKLLGLARKAGLGLIQKSPTARQFFMRQAMAAPDAAWLPRLIREGRLRD